jgi:hypothetical protein
LREDDEIRPVHEERGEDIDEYLALGGPDLVRDLDVAVDIGVRALDDDDHDRKYP